MSERALSEQLLAQAPVDHPARRRSARGRGPELRGEVLQAAMALLAETGDADAVSLRSVAQHVGVSVPAIYLHFADKQALLDAVCEEVWEQLHAAMRAAGQQADHPFEALRAQGNAYVHFAIAHPEHYRIVLMLKYDAVPESMDRVLAGGAFAYLLETVTACIADGVLVGEPLELALGLWAAAHGVAALLVAKPYFPWPPVETFVDNVICMAGIGLAARARLPEPELTPAELVERLDRLR